MANRLQLLQDDPQITKSNDYYARALGRIPAVTQTLAKGPGQYVNGVAPKYLKRGKGSHVWDVDGNEYLDLTMAVGPVSLGYCDESVDAAVRAQLEDGITFSLMHPLEVEVAEMIGELVPGAEMVRFSKTGCDVTSAAVRLARAYTGRRKVVCCGYHGWHDWYISVTDRNLGVPQDVRDLTFTFNYNDMQSLNDVMDDDTACVILEPVVFEPPRDDFLTSLKKACHENGSLLIFDEMWTGFRLAVGGAQQYFGVEADLVTYSKAIANGMPLSVLAGRKDVMRLLEKEVFFFTTFGGEALSLVAAKATLGELVTRRVPEHLARQGNKLKEGYRRIAAELGMAYTDCVGMDCRTMLTFDGRAGNPLEMKSLVQQEMIRRGVLWGGFHNLCYAHTDEDVAYALEAYYQALTILKQAVESETVSERLRGEVIEPVFRRTGNFNTKPRVAAAKPGKGKA